MTCDMEYKNLFRATDNQHMFFFPTGQMPMRLASIRVKCPTIWSSTGVKCPGARGGWSRLESDWYITPKVPRFIFIAPKTLDFQPMLCCFSFLPMRCLVLWDIWLTGDLNSSSTVAKRPLGVRVIVTICPQPGMGIVSCKPNGEGIPASNLAGNGGKTVWLTASKSNDFERTVYILVYIIVRPRQLPFEGEKSSVMLSKVARQDDNNFPPAKKQRARDLMRQLRGRFGRFKLH